jgi:ubiquinone/menaquinone biosynthesis C-methylase UbiE
MATADKKPHFGKYTARTRPTSNAAGKFSRPTRNNDRAAITPSASGAAFTGPGKFPHPEQSNGRQGPASNGAGKFPLRGRAGYLMRKKLAEDPIRAKSPQGRPTSNGTGGASTGWGGVAQWYHETVEDRASYQKDLIMPNLMRLMEIQKGQTVLDLGCGEGVFARRFAQAGAKVIAVDIAPELISIGEKKSAGANIEYRVASAHEIQFINSGSIDKIAIVLALQNIEPAAQVLFECERILKPGGKLFIVLNHPAFRIPKFSDWEWSADPEQSNGRQGPASNGAGGLIQYRRVWRYLSEARERIEMTPGAAAKGAGSESTISFHRPMQFFVKAIGKAGLALVNMEEWVSNKKSQPGPRAAAEDKARAEIPLFMALEVVKR